MKNTDRIVFDIDSIIKNKLKSVTFAKVIIFLDEEFRKKGFVYSRELSNFLKVSYSRALQIIQELRALDLIYKSNNKSVAVEWRGVKDGDKYLISRYVPLAIKTLKEYGIWREDNVE